MPPRYAYWTILIDDKPTAFRARERDELQPTYVQLQRKNTNVTMQWFARGRLWASREAERDDFQTQKHAASAPRERRGDRPEGAPERRGGDWRPGGAHKDPRDRFKKKNRPERAWSEKDPATQRDRDKPGYASSGFRDRGDRPWSGKPRDKADGARGDRPWSNKPAGEAPRGDRQWRDKPAGDGKRPWSGKPRERKPWNDKPAGSAPPSDRPWQTKPTGPRAQRKPWVGKPNAAHGFSPAKPRGERPWRDKPPTNAPRSDRPWQDKPRGKPQGDRPWNSKPPGVAPRGDRPWSAKPDGAQRFSPAKARGDRPWRDKPPSGAPRSDRPWQDKPGGKPPGDRPWSSKPPASHGGQRPWSGKPRDPNRKPFTPRGPRAGGAPGDRPPRKRRDDDPDRD